MLPFIKFIEPEAWDFGDARVARVKVSGRGIVGADGKILEKRSSSELLHQARGVHLHPGEDLIHLIAIGSTEHYGPNRNGDGFNEADCVRDHPTFAKHARFYRGHRNRDPQKSYGVVKSAYYNPLMHRIELLVALNRTKQAADRNGGLVADDEIQRLESGQDIPVSMACKIAFDVCSSCGNRARNRGEYCEGADEGGTCKHGGLKRNITKVAQDGHVLHAKNPNAVHFDISHVKKGADRIAQVLGVVKSAGVVSGAEIAEAWGNPCPEDVFLLGVKLAARDAARSAFRLAAREEELGGPAEIDRAFDRRIWHDKKAGDRLPGYTLGQHLRALADAKAVLPLEAFVELAAGPGAAGPAAAEKVAQAQARLPGLYPGLLATYELEDALAKNPYVPSPRVPDEPLAKWANARALAYGLGEPAVRDRMARQAVYYADAPDHRPTKTAVFGDDDAAEVLRHYALYQMAFLGHHEHSPDAGRLAEMVVRMNHAG